MLKCLWVAFIVFFSLLIFNHDALFSNVFIIFECEHMPFVILVWELFKAQLV